MYLPKKKWSCIVEYDAHICQEEVRQQIPGVRSPEFQEQGLSPRMAEISILWVSKLEKTYLVFKNLISTGLDCIVGERFQTSDSFNVEDVPCHEKCRH